MLYVSRVACPGSYYVADTDDDSEETATLEDLQKAIEAGVDIEGVHYSIKSDSEGRHRALIHRVYMCQPKDTVEPWQTKLKVLQGIEVITHKSVITTMNWVNKQFKNGTSIRLSDYCKALGSYALSGRGGPIEKCLIIILDDKIQVECNAFDNALHRNLKFDIREVTNDSVAGLLYKEALRYNMYRLRNMIIDGKERMDRWEKANSEYQEEQFW